jgi:hypothetical protein
MTKTLIIVFLLICGLVVSIVLATGFLEDVRRDQSNLEYYRSWFKTKTGWTTGHGSYLLVSLDGGKTWYDAESADEAGFVLNGPVEEVRPGLLKQVMGLDALMDHVEKHGPIDLSAPDAGAGIKVLEGAGFTVEGGSSDQ